MLLITSCSEADKQGCKHISMPEPQQIVEAKAMDSLLLDDLRQVKNWKLLSDSRLAVYDSEQSSSMLAVYELPSMLRIFSYGRKGRGPGEFLAPMWCEMKQMNQISLYDMALAKHYIMDIIDTTVNEVREMDLAKVDDLTKPYQAIKQIEDDKFLYHSELRAPVGTLLELYNIETQTRLDSLHTVLFTGEPYDAYVEFASIGSVVFAAFSGLNRVEMYRIEDDGNMEAYLTIGDEDARQIDDVNVGYMDVRSDGEYIYALNNKFAPKTPEARPVLEKWNMEGEMLKVYHFDRYINRVLIDKHRGVVLGFAPYSNQESIFVYELN